MANISAFSLTINYGGVDSYLIDSSAGGVVSNQIVPNVTGHVTASATQLFYDFSIVVTDHNFQFATSGFTRRWQFNDLPMAEQKT